MNNYDLKQILPHKPPMLLLDDVLSYDLSTKTLTALFCVNDKKIFFDKTLNGINSLVGIELMAQAIGCYSYFEDNKNAPSIGLLLGTRLFNNSIDKFELDEKYTILVKQLYENNQIYAFESQVFDKNNNEIQSATINVYKGDNIEEMISNG